MDPWYEEVERPRSLRDPAEPRRHPADNGWMQGQNGYNIGTVKNCASNFKRDLSAPRLGSPKKRGNWHF